MAAAPLRLTPATQCTSVGFFSASRRASSFTSAGMMEVMFVVSSSLSGMWYAVIPAGVEYLDMVMLTRHLKSTPESPRSTARASSALPKYTWSVSRVMPEGRASGGPARVHRSRSLAYHSLLSPIFIYMIQMADVTTLTANGLTLEFARERALRSLRAARTSTLVFFTLTLAASLFVLWLQLTEFPVFEELGKYARIKSAVRSWRPLVEAKTEIESDLGRQKTADRPELFEFRCVDFGKFYLPVRYSPTTFLPQAVRRGAGDGWMVHKAAAVDLAAQQFCESVLRHRANNVITCGSEMMRLVGYSGYFEDDHWCAATSGVLT
ncbi:hypothetical protein [Orf virus]|uniref:Uncharacterized protein n=1 Tax=Orf virus TaxID=10258 RepID=W5U3B9_ORFV|nr:hypothetical protein [Orf virus]